MINDELQRAWLEAVPTELEIPFYVGPRIPEFGIGDTVGIVTPVAGPGPTLEAINTVVGFQIRITARIDDYDALKKSAYQIHRALIFADVPGQLWGNQVVWISPAGADPTPDNPDGVDKDRVSFVCTYLAETEL